MNCESRGPSAVALGPVAEVVGSGNRCASRLVIRGAVTKLRHVGSARLSSRLCGSRLLLCCDCSYRGGVAQKTNTAGGREKQFCANWEVRLDGVARAHVALSDALVLCC